jgi:hypothetical protein
VDIAPPIYVAADSNEEEMKAKRDELQRALDELSQRGKEWATKRASNKVRETDA